MAIKPKLNPYIVGIFGFMGMILFYYFLLAIITNDFLHPFYFFQIKWYLFTPLFVGFAWQMFLWQKLRIVIQKNNLKMAGISASTSGVAMVACCAHHLADIFPIIGLTGVAIAVTKYQDLFLSFGILINIIGIIYMWKKLKQHNKMACCNI